MKGGKCFLHGLLGCSFFQQEIGYEDYEAF